MMMMMMMIIIIIIIIIIGAVSVLGTLMRGTLTREVTDGSM